MSFFSFSVLQFNNQDLMFADFCVRVASASMELSRCAGFGVQLYEGSMAMGPGCMSTRTVCLFFIYSTPHDSIVLEDK